jgi:exosortase
MVCRPDGSTAPSSDCRNLLERSAEAQCGRPDKATAVHDGTGSGSAAAAALGGCDAIVNTCPSEASALSDLVLLRRDWAVTGAALALALFASGLIFRSEIASAIFVWSNSAAYNHCFLVLPGAVFIAWGRRQAIRATVPRPAPWITLLAVPVAAGWFIADRLGIMEGQQLMAMTLFQIMAASVLGLGTWRVLAAPLLYLYFLVPFGESLIPPLQFLVVHFTAAGLDLFGVPNFIDGTMIQIPEGAFQVEQECAGLRFLFAMAAFSVPYVLLTYTSPRRRVLFVALFLAAAIIGNCFRVFGTVLIAHFTDKAALVEAGHVYGGWVFYMLLGLVLMLIGSVFRQEQRSRIDEVPPVARRTAHALLGVLASVILLSATPRVAADVLDRYGAVAIDRAPIEAPMLPGCSAVPLSTEAAAPSVVGPGVSSSSAYRCAGDFFVLSFYRYPPRIGARPLFLSLRAAETAFRSDVTILHTADFRARDSREVPKWRVTEIGTPQGRYLSVAIAVWINGRPTGTGIAARVNQALNSARRFALSPVFAVITHSAERDPNNARRAMNEFLPATGQLTEWVDKQLAERMSH